MKTRLVLALGLAAALGVGAADAWAAKPRLYTVSLSGEIRSS
jgi:hypothetical protein